MDSIILQYTSMLLFCCLINRSFNLSQIQMTNQKSNQQGFTLIELMVTIGILAILVAIALPNMSNWVNSQRVANRAEQTANLMRFARSESVRLGVPVVVCYSNIRADGRPDHFCQDTALNNGNGLSAFALRGALPYDASRDELLRTMAINQNQAAGGRVNISGAYLDLAGAVAAGTPNILVFYPNGTFGQVANNSGSVHANTAQIGIRSVRYRLTDAQANNDADRARRTSTLVLDPGGRVNVCPKANAPDACTNE